MRKDVEYIVYFAVGSIGAGWPIIHGLINPDANVYSDMAVFLIGFGMLLLAPRLFDIK